ncbi:MAG: Crp/Fnr family transcriptional regulator [Clostridiales bacterium]|nr:Crp/Fnr family transcriptional regulator [Clostridiales bacterium]
MEIKKLELHTFAQDQVIFKQGEHSDCMYDIVSGKVGIFVGYGEENEKQLTTLETGAYFGEMGMLECCPRSATAVALADGTQVRVITPDDFGAFFEERPDEVFAIMRHLSSRIRSLTQDYMEVCRTVAETVEAEEAGKPKSKSLKDRLMRFAEAYADAYQQMGQYGVDPSLYGGMMFW